MDDIDSILDDRVQKAEAVAVIENFVPLVERTVSFNPYRLSRA